MSRKRQASKTQAHVAEMSTAAPPPSLPRDADGPAREEADASRATSDEQPVHQVIQRIKSNQQNPALLSTDDRRRCVEVLRAEGYNLAGIAQILQRNERTIRRDLEHLRAQNALALDPQLPERMIGQLCQEAEHSATHLRRIAREPAASAMERLMAESAAFKIFKDLFEKLQSVGYLPKVPTGVVAEVYRHGDHEVIEGYDELAARLRTIADFDQSSGDATEDRARTTQCLLDDIQRAGLSARIDALTRAPLIQEERES